MLPVAGAGEGNGMVRLRRRRANVGTYVDPPVVPLAPIDRVVEEAMIIYTSAVQMTIKNRIIVSALGEHLDYDHEALIDIASAELERLADENDETADRLERERELEPPRAADGVPSVGAADESDFDSLLAESHRRRPRVHRLTAAALRTQARSTSRLRSIVELARLDAADEVLRAVSAQATRGFEVDADYDLSRGERLRELELQLAALATSEASSSEPVDQPQPLRRRFRFRARRS